MFKGKRVFISGGSGVIGRELVKKLYDAGAKVFVGDLKPRPLDWSEDILYRQGDLNYITKEELELFEPEYFFHLAATFERSTETYDFWEENYRHNVNLSHHLMNCLKDSKALKKVIFASSYLIYNPEQYSFPTPAPKAVRLKETDQIYPRNLCGVAKFSHEIELRFLNEFRSNQFESVSARIFRSYGKNSRDIISRWIRALLQGEELFVYKKEGIFDYIYAGDVADGLIKLASSPATGIYNLGTDNARRVEEVLDILKKYFPNMRTTDVDVDIPYEASQASMELFKEVTGWTPSKQLEDVIPELIQFYSNNAYEDEDNAAINVLITSISKKVPMINAVKKASTKLGNSGKVFGADADSNCLGKYFVDEFWEMPRISELNVEELIKYCNEHNITAIIPSRDGELEFFAKNKKILFDEGIRVMVSEPEVIEVCLDKMFFYKEASSKGFNAIPTVTNIDDIDCDFYVTKERYGAGSRNIGIGLTKEQAKEHAANLIEPIFQPMIEGTEVSIDGYVDLNGKVKGLIVRTRDLIAAGESQITTTMRNEELEKLCIDFLEKSNFYGHVVLQAFINNKGELFIIECNSRFGGASTLSINAGLDSFYWFLLESSGVDIFKYPFACAKKEMKQVRYAEDLIVI